MENEKKFFFINGYWKDDKSEFNDYKVKADDGMDKDDDDNIFFYGMNEDIIKDAIKLGKKTCHDFVITSYHK